MTALADPLELVRETLAAAFAPRERLTVSQWAERYRVVTTGASPGPWENDRAPYLAGVMDALGDPAVRRVTLIKAEQVGGTEVIFNALFWAIDQQPGPILYVYPNADVARDVNRKRLLPTLRACPRVAGLLGDERHEQSNLGLQFTNGAAVTFTGSNSDANLESFPYRVVVVDEVDRCVPGILGKVAGRVTSYPDHKIVAVGTPGDEGFGVDAAHAASTALRWWTPCPSCRAWHVRDDFSRVGWPMDDKRRPFDTHPDAVERGAWYGCPACEHRITPAEHRRTSLEGRWLQEGYVPDPQTAEPVWTGEGDPEPRGSHLGFAISGLMSTIAPQPFGKVAREFVVNKGPTRDWANRRAGKAWAVKGDRLEVSELRRLCTPAERGGYRMGECPPGSLALTLAADIQADRAYVEIRSWGERGLETGLVWCEEVRFREGSDLSELEPLLERAYPVRGGGDLALPVGAAFFDSGFFTETVYGLVARCRRRGLAMVWPVKGDGSRSVAQPITETPVEGRTRYAGSGLTLLRLKSNVWKMTLTERIRGERGFAAALEEGGPPGADGAHLVARFLLPEDAPEEYLLQLTAEQRVTELVAGEPVAVYRPRPGFENRNHYFDAACYNFGGAARVGVRELTAAHAERVRGAKARESRPAEKPKRQSRYGGRGMLDRGRA